MSAHVTSRPSRRIAPRANRRGDADVPSITWSDLVPAHQLVVAPPPAPPRQAVEKLRTPPSKRGWPQPHAGWAPNPVRPVVWRASSRQLAGIYPFLHPTGVPAVGAPIGRNVLTRQTFCCHPTAWVTPYGITNNPNFLVSGIPGSGKSAIQKALAFRLASFGFRTLVAGDTKGEYNRLVESVGGRPLQLGPGMDGRINPLDAGPLGRDLTRLGNDEERLAWLNEIHRRRMALLVALIRMQGRSRRGVPDLDEFEEMVLDVALREATGQLYGSNRLATPTLGELYRLVREPTDGMLGELAEPAEYVRRAGQRVRAALSALVNGHLGGLFDRESSDVLDWSASPIQSVDISRMTTYGADVVAMVLTCVSTWAQAVIDEPNRSPIVVVRDELWRQMRSGGPAMVAKIDSDLRLSRAEGTVQMLATHKLEDFESVGDTGSEAVNIAKGLVASCDVRVTLAQDVAPLAVMRAAVGLTDAECEHIASWGRPHRGRALWKVGRAGGSHIVQLQLTPYEQQLFHTDERMEQ